MKNLMQIGKLYDQSGGVLAYVAILMVVLLGLAAIVIDGGRLYTEKSKLQKALDATVLAGAHGLRTSEARATEIAIEISTKNGYKVSAGELTFTGNSIKATKQINVSMTFAKIIGINNTRIKATATAMIAPLTKAGGIAPIVIDKSNIPDSTILNCGGTNPGTLQGNCGYLKYTGGNLKSAFQNGGTYEVGKTAFTDPGGSVGQVKQAIDELIASDALKPQCQSASTADNQCNRVITVAVIENWVDIDGKVVTGSSEVRIVGFASYWIEKYEDKKLYGQFIKMISPGEIGTGTGTGEYDLYGVKLIE